MANDEKRTNVQQRRSGKDRRSGVDTRSEEEKKTIGDRRSGIERRSGVDRRSPPAKPPIKRAFSRTHSGTVGHKDLRAFFLGIAPRLVLQPERVPCPFQ